MVQEQPTSTVQVDEEVLRRLYSNCGLFYGRLLEGHKPTTLELWSFYHALIELGRTLPEGIYSGKSQSSHADYWRSLL